MLTRLTRLTKAQGATARVLPTPLFRSPSRFHKNVNSCPRSCKIATDRDFRDPWAYKSVALLSADGVCPPPALPPWGKTTSPTTSTGFVLKFILFCFLTTAKVGNTRTSVNGTIL